MKLHTESKLAFADLLDRSIRERDEEYARRNSPEAVAASNKAYAEWWEILNFADAAVTLVKKAVVESNNEELALLRKRIREALPHEKLKDKPRASAALHRALGIAEEADSRIDSAVAEYAAALNLDPKAGCQRDLKRLSAP